MITPNLRYCVYISRIFRSLIIFWKNKIGINATSIQLALNNMLLVISWWLYLQMFFLMYWVAKSRIDLQMSLFGFSHELLVFNVIHREYVKSESHPFKIKDLIFKLFYLTESHSYNYLNTCVIFSTILNKFRQMNNHADQSCMKDRFNVNFYPIFSSFEQKICKKWGCVLKIWLWITPLTSLMRIYQFYF